MVGVVSYILAASQVNQLAIEFFSFMAEEIANYADGQWNLLVDNNVVGNSFMEEAAKQAVENFSRSMLKSDTQVIFALNQTGSLVMNVGPATPTDSERQALMQYITNQSNEFINNILIENRLRTAYTISCIPFSWQIFVTEERQLFYGKVEAIFRTSIFILIGTLTGGTIILFVITAYLTKPIEAVVKTLKQIIDSNNLKDKVPVYYNDEIGQLSNTFNDMLTVISAAYDQIKEYAIDAAVAKKREMKIRNIFQLYVPKDVIDEVFTNSEKMLIGNNRNVAILFSDIRSFATISENMTPEALVHSLNRYFETMVNIIMEKNGIVDKYIGDAIMAMFGAPISHGNDSLSSVQVALKMMDALKEFNATQINLGAPEFKIGVGINYGIVTVGNIGCDKKMNYTVIGDAVNLASRLEGLTKIYKEPVLFAESVYENVKNDILCRMIDKVAVKGKNQGVPIYTARVSLSKDEEEVWNYHNEAVFLYYERQFNEALNYFEKALIISPLDPVINRFKERCSIYIKNPPPDNWNGVEIMTEK